MRYPKAGENIELWGVTHRVYGVNEEGTIRLLCGTNVSHVPWLPVDAVVTCVGCAAKAKY